jgi:outer membrane protein TolC
MLNLVTMGWGMKSWLAKAVKTWLAGSAATILGLVSLPGCQPTFLAKEVYDGAHAALPPRLEENSYPITEPISTMTAAPATVSRPDRPPRYLSLQEAIAIALENGVVAGRGVTNLGLIPAPGGGPPTTTQIFFPPASQNDSMRILALNPAVSSAAIEIAASRFDAMFASSLSWTGVDGLLGVPSLSTSFQNNDIFAGLNNTGGQTGRYEASIIKAFASGAVANLSFLTDYRNLNSNGSNPVPANGLLNPQYTARFSIGFEQPLWRDFGVAINQILPLFPSPSGLSLLSQNDTLAFGSHQNKTGTDGILIARLKFDQSRAHFENNVNTLLANVEIAYWNLYNKYGQLYSFEENLAIMQRVWQESFNKHKLGSKDVPPENYFQVRGQYEEFRGERLRALNEVLEAERDLRSVLGLPPEDGYRLVPIESPTMAEVKPSWENSFQEALSSRPDLAYAREELTKNQYALSVALNNLKPDLRLFARFEPFGEGSTLTGNGTFLDSSGPGGTPGISQPSNAFRSLMNGRLADYQVGLALNMPLGFRAEHAAVRSARLELTKNYYLLRDWENLVVFQVTREYQELDHWYKRIQVHREERKGYQESLRKYEELFKGGKLTLGTPQLLEVQRRYAAAQVKEYTSIAEYNSTLARLEWAKGTILRYDNVHIGEGALPECVAVRAVDNEKERTLLRLRERPDALHQPGRLCLTKDTVPTSSNGWPGVKNAQGRSAQEQSPLANVPFLGEDSPAPGKNGNVISPEPNIPGSWPKELSLPQVDGAGAPSTTLPQGGTVGPFTNPERKQGDIGNWPNSFPKQQPSPAPLQLPKVEGASMLPKMPPSSGALPNVPNPERKQGDLINPERKRGDSSGFVVIDDPKAPSAQSGNLVQVPNLPPLAAPPTAPALIVNRVPAGPSQNVTIPPAPRD